MTARQSHRRSGQLAVAVNGVDGLHLTRNRFVDSEPALSAAGATVVGTYGHVVLDNEVADVVGRANRFRGNGVDCAAVGTERSTTGADSGNRILGDPCMEATR